MFFKNYDILAQHVRDKLAQPMSHLELDLSMGDDDDVVGSVPVRPGLEEGRVGFGVGIGGVVGDVGHAAQRGVRVVEGERASPVTVWLFF